MQLQRIRRGLCLAALFCVPVRAAEPGWVALVNSVVRAVNAGRPEVARRYSAAPQSFRWIGTENSSMIRDMFQPNAWRADVLEPPFTNGAKALAVFHTWHAPESDGDHVYPLVKTPAGWRLGREISERDTQGYRITHHALSITLTPSAKKASVTDTATLVRDRATPPVALIRLSDDFRVSSVTFRGRKVPFQQAGGIIAVRAPGGRSVPLTLTYAGKVDHKNFSAVRPDYTVLCSYYWPSLGRLPATADTRIEAPHGWTGLTQGELVSHTDDGKTAKWAWHNPLPVDYFTVDAGRYTETHREVGRVTLYTYLRGAKAGFAESLLDALQQALPYYEKRFGPYPYTRYSVVDGGPVMGFVALEGYSFATYGTLTLQPFVLAHELSHTWWGGIVPNTYLHSWWNEAFASYSDDSFSRMRNGITARHPNDKPWWPAYDVIKGAPLSTARDTDAVSAIAYHKGMLVLRLLEDQVGTPTFDRILQTFVKRQRSALDTDWPDFQRTVESVTGRSWGWFFRQWVDRAGWPALSLANVKVSQGASGWEVTGEIVQDGAPYRLGVPVRAERRAEVDTDGRSRERIDTATVTVPVTGARTPFRLSMDVRPAVIALDPAFDIPRRFGLNDLATIRDDGSLALSHSREEPPPSPFKM